MRKAILVTLEGAKHKVFPSKNNTPWPDIEREVEIDSIPEHWERDIVFTMDYLGKGQLCYISEEEFKNLFEDDTNRIDVVG